MLTELDVAREKKEVQKNIREKEEMVTSGVKRKERKKRPVVIPCDQGLRRTEKNLALIQSTDVLEDLKYSTAVVGIPKRSSGEGQSGWPSEVYKINCDECEASYYWGNRMTINGKIWRT